MISSTRVSGLLKILVALAIFCWSLSYLGLSTSDYKRVLRKFKGEKARFVEDFLNNEIGGDFEGEAIATLCANRTWTKGLLFQCEPPPGGIGEVRNAHLNSELIVPEIVKRDDRDIAKVVPDAKAMPRGIPLDYYYDKQHLNWTLSHFCPQMKLTWSIDELYNIPMGNPVTISVSEVGMSQVNGSLMETPQTWFEKYQEFIDTKSNPKTRTWPFKVIVGRNTYVWPTSYDHPAFVKNFGRILRFRYDVRQLAASALHSMQKHWIKPHTSAKAVSAGTHGFVGIHLRTEKDVWGTDFPVYEEQAAYYLDYVIKSPYRVAYLASGATAEDITAFTARARDFNITVVTKRDLLAPEELQYLASLTWDQQALVDFELLLRANLMAGVSASSFAWNVALRRAASFGYVGGHAPVSNLSEHVRWQDGVSVVMGKDDDKNIDMQLGIWP
ncbi:hypothetical protein SUNI508_07970 [Seiridium unicorne]|uniref:Alternative oxidase n=1 Tax=Seiridium unicorne TaxID=138068 RepID=A0ABR2UVE8_9PEZI